MENAIRETFLTPEYIKEDQEFSSDMAEVTALTGMDAGEIFDHWTGNISSTEYKIIAEQRKPPKKYVAIDNTIYPSINMLSTIASRTPAEHERIVQQKIREQENMHRPVENSKDEFYLPEKISYNDEYVFEEIQRVIRNTNIQRKRTKQKQETIFSLGGRLNMKFESLQ